MDGPTLDGINSGYWDDAIKFRENMKEEFNLNVIQVGKLEAALKTLGS